MKTSNYIKEEYSLQSDLIERERNAERLQSQTIFGGIILLIPILIFIVAILLVIFRLFHN